MRILLIVSFLIYHSDFAFSQQHEVRFRINQISVLDTREEVRTDDEELIITPEEQDKSKNFSVDIAYLRNFKSIKWLLRVGFKGIDKSGELKLARDTFYIVSKNKTLDKTLNFGFGVYRPFYWHDKKLSLNIGVIGNFQYTYLSSLEFRNDSYNQFDSYLSGAKVEYDFANSWRAGISFDLGLYYYVFNNFGIGVENNNLLYFDKVNGVTHEERFLFDDKENKIDKITIEHDENRSVIGKAFSFSIVFSYKF